MNDSTDFHALERKWLARWDENSFTPDAQAVTGGAREKRYALTMFPYPSGDLHMGHAEVVALHDVTARYWRLKGYEVFNPIGWDSFGLPAENAAIKRGQHPSVYTEANIATQEASFKRYGTAFDWTHRFHTSDPSYYRWTQWLFLQLHRANLAELRDGSVNWCPQDATVLANEQVIDGRCDRCDSVVTKRVLKQWYFTMSNYAQQLLDDMESLEGKWPTPVLNRQRAWIGRSEGAEIQFRLKDSDEVVTAYTTRPDTLHGVTFLAMAPDAAITEELNRNAEFFAYREATHRASDIDRQSTNREKTGVSLNRTAVHPFTGEDLPIYAADYVLAHHGTGIVMGVPAQDQRDLAFARKYGLVVEPTFHATSTAAPTENGPAAPLESSEKIAEAVRVAIEELEARNSGGSKVDYRLRDWLVSRQRYWGAPIPIVHCDGCGAVPVPEADLPVLLPELSGKELAPENMSPLAAATEWLNTDCPQCGGAATRDTDTMDTFVDSSWYFLRYPSAHNSDAPWAEEDLQTWGPVDQYMGGAEHATMHLLYSRFITKVLFDLKLISFNEPFTSLVTQGVVINEGERMRKSKGNGVDLGEQLAKYGVDAVRLALVFAGPPEDNIDWAKVSPKSAQRFLARAARLAQDVASPVESRGGDEALRRITHGVRASAEEALEASRFNVAIARVMELVNATRKAIDSGPGPSDPAVREAAETVAVILSLVTPFTAAEMYSVLGHDEPVAAAEWPAADASYLIRESVTCVVQVNGKFRAKLKTHADVGEAALVEQATAAAKAHLTSPVRRTIVVAPKVVNFVL